LRKRKPLLFVLFAVALLVNTGFAAWDCNINNNFDCDVTDECRSPSCTEGVCAPIGSAAGTKYCRKVTTPICSELYLPVPNPYYQEGTCENIDNGYLMVRPGWPFDYILEDGTGRRYPGLWNVPCNDDPYNRAAYAACARTNGVPECRGNNNAICDCVNFGTGDCRFYKCNPPPGLELRGNCMVFNNYPEWCQADNSHGGECRWVPGASCQLIENKPCTPGNVPPEPCCKSGLLCVNVGGTSGGYECRDCIPTGSFTQCDPNHPLQCCSHYCSSSGICSVQPPANQPPAEPDAPHIIPDPLYPDGTASCNDNCPPDPLPIDPDADPVEMQYKWVASTGSWSPTLTPFNCAAQGCTLSQAVQLQSRACDEHDCSAAVDSNILIVQPAPPPPSAPLVCESDNFNGIMVLAGIAAVAMAALIALVYMFGEFFKNPKMTTWAKSEAAQVIISLAIVSVLLFVLSMFCEIQVGEFEGMFGVPLAPAFSGHADENIYNGALLYLEKLGSVGIANMASLRYNLGAYEVRTTFTKYTCDDICLLSLASTNEAVFAGETINLAITNNLLGTATIAYLSIAFQHFTLIYILGGLFAVFLPLAIVVRSIPFMRQFGGGLIGIFVALFMLYPAMLVANAYVLPGFAASSNDLVIHPRQADCVYIGTDVFGTNLECHTTELVQGSLEPVKKEWDLFNIGTSQSAMESIPPSDLAGSIKLNVLIFLAAVFLPAVNFIIIAALARDLSRFLGEEADISRLGKMV